MKVLKWLDENLEEAILMIFLVVMAFAMMAQVIMRYFFKASMPWPEEFCRMMFVFSGFLSMGYCVRKDKMLKVDILLGFFPEGLKKIIDIASKFITLAFFAYLGYMSWGTVQAQKMLNMSTPAMGWPWWMVYASVTIGCILGVIRQIEDIVKYFSKKEEK